MTKNVFFSSSSFNTLKGVNHAFFSRQAPGLFSAYSQKTRKKLAPESNQDLDSPINIDELQKNVPFILGHLVQTEQVHGKEVFVLKDKKDTSLDVVADAQVSAVEGLSLGILTADCVPVLFADDKNRIIGAAHAGWKGAFDGVIAATVTKMLALGAEKQSLHAVIGPCIRQENYEVGPEFYQQFVEKFAGHHAFFKPASQGKWFFDLPSFVMQRLNDLQLKSVTDTHLDTFSRPHDFFSYRRSTLNKEKLEGYLLSVISLEKLRS